MEPIEFPLQVSELEHLIPHRPPMVWVDEILWIKPGEGVVRVHWDKKHHYNDEHGIRLSSYIEWIAQAYAFSQALEVSQGISEKGALKKAYLVGVKNAEVFGTPNGEKDGPFDVYVKTLKELGPLSIFEGNVSNCNEIKIASAILKVFTE